MARALVVAIFGAIVIAALAFAEWIGADNAAEQRAIAKVVLIALAGSLLGWWAWRARR